MLNEHIQLAHGAGGILSQELINKVFFPYFENSVLKMMDDSASLHYQENSFAFTTDSYVVNPLFFPGGNIGKLAVCGTVNDLAVVGAKPLVLSAAFILEEGFSIDDLHRILSSMREMSEEAGVKIVTGDTKVVPRGEASKLFINTSGVGIIPKEINVSASNVQPGDSVIISGPIGAHEMAVLIARGEFEIESEIKSDCAPLNKLIEKMLSKDIRIHAMRDITRGGLATILHEIANASNVGIYIKEGEIPVSKQVKNICSLLGFDPLYLANEGCLVAFCPQKDSKSLVELMREHPYGLNAVEIGEVLDQENGHVILETLIGGHRLLEPLTGGQFPRIC